MDTSACAQQRLPAPVETYLTGIESRLLAEPQVQATKDDLLSFHYSLLFHKPAIDFRSGTFNAWVIGFTIGELKGKALTTISRIVVIAADGTELFKYPDPNRREDVLDGGYTDAIVITMAPSFFLIAMASPADRSGPGEVSIWTLGQNPRELMIYRDANFPGEPGMESDLYFYDADGDGRKELLIEQQLLYYSKGWKKMQQQIYKLDSSNQSFSEATSSFQNRLGSIFTMAKGNAATPKITQLGRPYDPAVFATPAP